MSIGSIDPATGSPVHYKHQTITPYKILSPHSPLRNFSSRWLIQPRTDSRLFGVNTSPSELHNYYG